MSGDRYVVVEMVGSGTQAVGFVEGLRLGSGHKGPVWFAGHEELGIDGFLNKLQEALNLELHAVMTAEFADQLATALENAPLIAIEITEVKTINSAELGFKFKCFTREQAEEIREIVKRTVPDGVELQDYEEEETVNPDSKGVELYTPTHDYELEGKGRYLGAIPGVIDMAHKLAENELIHPEKIQLNSDE
jgi:hypothetical protein